jgi:hypothetical protein
MRWHEKERGGVQERDLIVGVLAAQAGFVTPSEVLTAAAAGLVDASDSLLTRLERSGAPRVAASIPSWFGHPEAAERRRTS